MYPALQAAQYNMQGIRVQDLLIPDDKSSEDSAVKEERSTKPDPGPSETKYFVIEFIHDTICPFCYIGMKNLFMAIESYKSAHPDAVFEVTCTPFILAPNAKNSWQHEWGHLQAKPRVAFYWYDRFLISLYMAVTENHVVMHQLSWRPAILNDFQEIFTDSSPDYDKDHYYSTERGLPKSRFEVWDRLGKSVGIKFSWKGRTGNSRNSHKLLRFALQKTATKQKSTELAIYKPGVDVPLYPPYSLRAPDLPVSCIQARGPDLQMRLLDAITTKYHEHDKDLSDPQFLIEVTRAVTGFPEDEIRAVLDSQEWDLTIDVLSSEVQNRISVRSQLAGPIVAVPTMVLNNRWVYGGFQKWQEIVSQFDLLRQGINPLQEYTRSSLVLDGGIADTIAREAAIARGNGSSNSHSSGSGSGSNNSNNRSPTTQSGLNTGIERRRI
ncbi:hypothetical protein EKO27_g6608 [Xylaria grammica]|uniref:DSBA-like thioredoxin domain-containing protein n=1 Tax=Xylaria grammica TaxID=363999 RepID=A0A439D276_9PEZI|nr:hypothetical protein EKO27_g6608 [Xylaria grammica]